MTKLMQWLLYLFSFLAFYIGIMTDTFLVKSKISPRMKEVIAMSPLYILIAFGSYSLIVIGYRVATFNDCESAADELKLQLKEARVDLKEKGFVFAT